MIYRAIWAALVVMLSTLAFGQDANLVNNPDFTQRDSQGNPAGYQISGDATYRYLGDPSRDTSGWGIAFDAMKSRGSVSQTVAAINPAAGRWYRFTFRGLPQDDFAVAADDDLSMRVEFYGDAGRTGYDAKAKPIWPQVLQDREDFTTNGDRHIGGAAVWRTYQLDFWLPFPQVDTVRLSVNFSHGQAIRPLACEFFVSDFSLTRLSDIPPQASAKTTDRDPRGALVPLGGRWYFEADSDHPTPPRVFDYTEADRLLYHDSKYSAPFAGNMTAWLRAGDKDENGDIMLKDSFVSDNVTVSFTADAMVIHTKGLPNHPTGKFPETGFGNPNFITEHDRTYFIPLDPKVNPRHIFTTRDNSNHALPMGPIGVAVNGVVFFNPFDAQSQDASSLMDRCCGHPAPDGTYHYHKYPICVNSPWADEGKEHSPVIGWAFDGFPIYGPFESDGVMAKDLKGSNALNEFNLHFDPERGWHYHVTPGEFPYIIGGYWGTEDPRDRQPGGGRPRGMGGGPGFMPPPPQF
jgi:hypothetical protein